MCDKVRVAVLGMLPRQQKLVAARAGHLARLAFVQCKRKPAFPASAAWCVVATKFLDHRWYWEAHAKFPGRLRHANGGICSVIAAIEEIVRHEQKPRRAS